MVDIEDPITTLVRLLDTNMRVVKNDGSLAKIHVSKEWYDRELLKNYDGQVTVGLDRSEDQKIGFSGTSRRRIGYARVNTWTIQSQDMRDKIRQEINRIIREKRTKPDVTPYDFVGVGQATGTHKAYHAGAPSSLPPDSASWTELTDAEYEKIWYSDDSPYSKSVDINGNRALMLFRFKVDPDEKVVKQIILKFEGYGTAPSGNGVTIVVWNHVAQAWQNAQSGTAGTDEVITITLTSNLTDFVEASGYVYLLAATTNASNGVTAAVLYCDYTSCTITVNGITYVDMVNYRDLDNVRVKPFLWRTEFLVKTWLFENVMVT